MSRRTSLKLTDERERQLERASEIVASDADDDPPMSVVIDAALAHLIQSDQNIRDAREELGPATIQCSTPMYLDYNIGHASKVGGDSLNVKSDFKDGLFCCRISKTLV